MLISTKTKVKWNGRNKQHFIEKGYVFTKIGEEFEVKVEDLTKGSKSIVKVKCDYCGKIVEKTYQTYCSQHDKEFGDCCVDCQPKKNELVCLKKYGVTNGAKTQQAIEKTKTTCNNKYGVDNPSKLPDVKDKIRINNIKSNSIYKLQKGVKEKYGVDNIMRLEAIKDNISSTWLQKYGVSHPKKSPLIIEKEKQGNLIKYGVQNVAQLEEVKQKIRQTCLEKYGVDCSLKSKEVREKIRKSYYTNSTIPTSSQQIKLCNLLKERYGNCELNSICGNYFLDCVVVINNQKINVEYDGWYWHKDKQEKDMIRNNYVVQHGYKVLRIIGSHGIPCFEEINLHIQKLLNEESEIEIINMIK